MKQRFTGSILAAVVALGLGSSLLTGPQVQAGGPYALKKIVDADQPIQVLANPSTRAVFVVEKTGRIRSLENTTLGTPVLDIHTKVSSGGEQGLLGAAFSPKGDWLYTNHTDTNGDTRITAYPFNNRADEEKAVELLKVDQPYSNHNGGGLDVTNDGVLWIALGDGGSGGDPQGYGQNRKALLGKILRIQPTPTSAAEPYTIPSGNLTGPGDRKEIWAYGLRNPWRFDVDEVSKTVWIADVGQNEWEEINNVPLSRTGANFGWKNREGTRPFKGGKRPAGAIEPVVTYGRSSGCSITGGFIYRGTALPGLRGNYLYTDYCRGTIKRLAPGSRKPQTLDVNTKSPSSFGTDADGEIYVTSLEGGVYKLGFP